jgi:hypothetical protein
VLNWRYAHCGFSPTAAQGAVFTGLEVAAIAGAVSAVGSIGMGIIGGAQQADAQRQAGETAYRTALIRNQQLEAQAKELENQAVQRQNEAKIQEQRANDQQGVAQRKAIEQKRKAQIVASRAGAVMAASGGGVDPGVLASILAEGEYAGDVALYEGDVAAGDSRYGAKVSRYQGDLNRYEAATKRWSGGVGVNEGAYTRAAYNSRADTTMTGSLIKAGFSGLSLASKYAPDFGGGYDLGSDTMRTAGDMDLGGYSGGRVELYDDLR